MNRLKSFEIVNYRSCLKTNLEFTQNIMCLIGINGAGKSNILNAIQLLKQMGDSPRQRYRLSTSKSKEFINNDSLLKTSGEFQIGEKILFFQVLFLYDTDERNNDKVIDSVVKVNLKQFGKKSKWIELPGGMFEYISKDFLMSNSLSFFKVKFTSTEIEALVQLGTFFRSISYYGASQFSDPSKSPISLELEESRQYRGRSVRSEQHEKFLYDLYVAYKSKSNLFKQFLSAVNKEGIGLIDGISFSEHDMPSSSFEVKSGGKIKKIERLRQLIIPFINVDGVQLSPNQLSEGSYKTLALIFYIVNDQNDLLLIEEPEIGVHHGLLNSIIALIKTQSQNKQIIISTHSDFVLDHLEPENVIIIRKEPNLGTTSKALPKLLSKNDYKALKTYLLDSGNLGEYWKIGGFNYE